MVVLVMGTLRFPVGAVETVRPHLRDLVEATRRLDGCMAYDVAEDLFDPGLIRFSEVWPDGASLQRHLAAPHIAPWRAVCARLGLISRDFVAYDADGARPV